MTRPLPSLAMLALSLTPLFAHAGARGGAPPDSGLGPVGQVGGGLSGAGGGGGDQVPAERAHGDAPFADTGAQVRAIGDLYHRVETSTTTVIVNVNGEVVRTVPAPRATGGTARLTAFIGAQAVADSNTAFVGMLAIEDRWLRLAGTVWHYREAAPVDAPTGRTVSGGALMTEVSLTHPTLVVGVRLNDHRRDGGPRAFLEGGVTLLATGGVPSGDVALTGSVIGAHFEQPLSARGRRALIADAHAMFFQANIRAYAARVGVRIGPLEAGLRVLDVSMGPAIYGPELGLRF